MKAILKWQYDQLVKELLLLQEHQSDPGCPCATAGEMCVRKHLLAIEGYAQETMAMEGNQLYKDKLEALAKEARLHREQEEQALRGEGEHVELTKWCRDWRKEFEAYSLQIDESGSDQDQAGSSKKVNVP
ncbi:MAG: hypothetical protein GX893_06040 [Firmicutes bacterium]|nr:hypothetical protein [Bacillota bacterium]